MALLPIIAGSPSLGQPRLPDGFVDELVFSGLNTPVAVAPLPDGGILVSEQYAGIVRLIQPDGESQSLLTLSDLNPDGEERGVLGLAVDQKFPERPYFYLYYTAEGNVCKLTRYRLRQKDGKYSVTKDSEYVILDDIPNRAWNHNGGTLRFGPDNMLYLSIGDDANACSAQSSSDLRGVILRLNIRDLPDSGSGPPAKKLITPEDNPLLERESANDSLTYAYGLRNPFRFHLDAATGDLMIADVGQLKYEEVDYISKNSGGGQNFGWPFWEGPVKRRRRSCPPRPGENFVPPVANYDRTGFRASIISLALYRSESASPWPDEYQGDYLYVDYYAGFVRRLKKSSDDSWMTPSAVPGQPSKENWAEDLKNVADSYVGIDGALYYLRQFSDTYQPNSGQIRRIRYIGDSGE